MKEFYGLNYAGKYLHNNQSLRTSDIGFNTSLYYSDTRMKLWVKKFGYKYYEYLGKKMVSIHLDGMMVSNNL